MFKGTSNANGRPKGSKNKTTNKVKEAFANLLENNLDRLQEDIDSLKPLERLKIILELASYTTPKLKAIERQREWVEQPLFPDVVHKIMSIPDDKFEKDYND